ncbi:SDR family NAD(P)-dependent oxidoreductase [Neobacillus niacini]|uniref:SDR family NAD(P)-dependent oxidoreductase n=1 Tax=Neobacillus niacini TaxID=86668 RepID=UPI00203B5294|nr:SDR family NAD(P)-dependent oxidoreductase [Neobacillus niacini]MCM3691221.1 SDR family oxidoreductase [Neobacillus niacini]
MSRFDGRVAIITGGSRGIGYEVASKFAEEGAKVAIFDINESELAKAANTLTEKGYDVTPFVANVTKVEEVEGAVDAVKQQYGRVDILINNAGVTRDNLLFKMTDNDWNTVIDVHLKGAFYCARAVQKYMVENKYGRIVNLSSIAALGNRGQTNYSTAKAGLQGFTKTLAIELGKFGITANAIAPGFIETEMTKATAERLGIPFDEFINASAAEIPVRRVGQPSDIAHTAAFLCDEASSFVSGQVIYVAGGPTN